MYEIEVRVRWRSGHRLMNYEGKCKNLHGEGYTGIFIFQKKRLGKDDIALDFGLVRSEIRAFIEDHWDHATLLNRKDVFLGETLKSLDNKICLLPYNPTAERMSEFLFRWLKSKRFPIKKVGIVESFEDSIAWYYE